MSVNIIRSKYWRLQVAGRITDKPVTIAHAVWSGVGTDGDDLVITDLSGDKRTTRKGVCGLDTLIWPGLASQEGFILATLDSGTLEVELA